MGSSGLSQTALSITEQRQIASFLEKHKTFPYSFSFNKAINGTNFATADGSSTVKFYSLSFQPTQFLGIVAIACNYIITPNSTVDIFAVSVTAGPTAGYTLGNYSGNAAQDLYELKSNGAAINDFEVFYPLNWYLEPQSTINIIIAAGTTTVTAGTSTIQGKVILHTIRTNMGGGA